MSIKKEMIVGILVGLMIAFFLSYPSTITGKAIGDGLYETMASSAPAVFSNNTYRINNSKYYDWDTVSSIIQARDGGYLLLGQVDVSDGGQQTFNLSLIKTDNSGNYLWNQSYDNETTYVRQIVKGNDNGYVITRNIADTFTTKLIKINETGDKLWSTEIMAPVHLIQ